MKTTASVIHLVAEHIDKEVLDILNDKEDFINSPNSDIFSDIFDAVRIYRHDNQIFQDIFHKDNVSKKLKDFYKDIQNYDYIFITY